MTKRGKEKKKSKGEGHMSKTRLRPIWIVSPGDNERGGRMGRERVHGSTNIALSRMNKNVGRRGGREH